jgi:hypothetical protein
MKKNMDQVPKSDEEYREESYEMLSDSYKFPSYQNSQNIDVMSCYTIGNNSGGKNSRDKNMFICGLTPQQIKELKTAKTNMEAKINSLTN